MQIQIALVATSAFAAAVVSLGLIFWPINWILDGGFLSVTILCFGIWSSLTAWALTRTEF